MYILKFILLGLENLGNGVIYLLRIIIISFYNAGLIALSLVVSFYKLVIKLIKKSIKFLIFLVSLKWLRFKIEKPFKKKKYINKHKKYKPITVFDPKQKFIKIRYFIYGSLAASILVLIPLTIYTVVTNLPDPKYLTIREIPQTTRIFDRNGILLGQIYGPEDRTIVKLDSIPDDLIKATIAIEDKNFYSHPGFDIFAIARAARENVMGGTFQGGSTITQQLIKSSFLNSEPSISRKIHEIILAFWAERLYDKNEILEMYFNQIPYGGTAWGASAASKVYFDKNLEDLNLSESAFLAGITQAPSLYSPYGNNPDLWKKRQREVLDNMVELGYISKMESDIAYNQELSFQRPQNSIHAPHFVSYVKNLLVEKYGLGLIERGGLNIKTSLDLKIQKEAEKIVEEEVLKSNYLNLRNGALLVTDPKTGEVLAMVGSYNYNDEENGKFNVTTSLQQPGSSIKVVTYALALTKGYTAATALDDSAATFATPNGTYYTPVNYDGRFYGRVPLRFALANSLNIPAVKLLQQVGIQDMIALARKMGITTWNEPEKYGLSITLGAAEVTMLDMATVYGTLANLGGRVDPKPIINISDSRNKVIENDIPEPRRVLDSSVSYIISDILSDNEARATSFGLDSPLNIKDHKVSVKTGTTDNKRDNWTIGYTDNYVVTVWVGNNDNSPMSQSLASGITGAAPIFNRMMTYLLSNNPEKAYPKPENIITLNCLGKNEIFIQGTENRSLCRTRFSSPTPLITLPN